LLVNFARWKQVEIRLSKSRLFYEEAFGMMVKFGKNLSILKNDKLLARKKSNQFFNVFFVLFDFSWGFFFLCFYCFIEVEIKLAYAKKFVYNKTID
jgi:hypothetical protein